MSPAPSIFIVIFALRYIVLVSMHIESNPLSVFRNRVPHIRTTQFACPSWQDPAPAPSAPPVKDFRFAPMNATHRRPWRRGRTGATPPPRRAFAFHAPLRGACGANPKFNSRRFPCNKPNENHCLPSDNLSLHRERSPPSKKVDRARWSSSRATLRAIDSYVESVWQGLAIRSK